MFKRILAPLDGSSLAEAVLPLARYLAERFQATLVLFHVVEKDAPEAVHGQHHLRQVAEASDYLEQVARQWSATGVSIVQDVHEVQEAGVAQTIRDHTEELHADLIVLCEHGQGGLRGALSGSIAEQVIRQGTAPVLFIRPAGVKDPVVNPIRRILLPLDGLKAHEVAAPVAVALATQCAAQLCVLTVVPTAETLPVKEAITARLRPLSTMAALNSSAHQAEKYVQKITRDLLAQGLLVSGVVLRGDAAAKLMETIAAESIDLVVMATHGHSAIDAHWEGSQTPGFLSRTPVPVVLVRGEEERNV